MKVFHNIYIALGVFFACLLIFLFSVFRFYLSGVSDNEELKDVVIKKGGVASIAETLYQENLIRNKSVFLLYVKLSGKTNLKAGNYQFSENMGVQAIVQKLYQGGDSDRIVLTFKEGYNMRKIASTIADATNYTMEDVLNFATDTSYLEELISKYWFLGEEISNQQIYYPLEGYLYPDTYFIESRDTSLLEIFELMLDEMDKRLTSYRSLIVSNKYSLHEILTIASIAELEGINLEDRQGIIGVLLNRLSEGWTLGCDVTTYYGAKKDLGAELLKSELSSCNAYNTRCSTFVGLPVGPICNSSIETVEAVLNPVTSDYYYFIADKNHKVYFSRTDLEHNKIKKQLEDEGLSQ